MHTTSKTGDGTKARNGANIIDLPPPPPSLSQLPRTFVNLIQILDATKIAPLRGLVCDAVHL